MSEITKNQIKLIRSLQQKKTRKEYGLFTVEGKKNVLDLIHSDFPIEELYSTEEVDLPINHVTISKKQLSQISSLKQSEGVLAMVKIKNFTPKTNARLTLVLDTINDPGNLGTIIRTADWFGVDQIICSSQTVDCYNPKVVQAAKGSLFHIPIVYTDLIDFLKDRKNVYGASLDGEAIGYNTKLESSTLVMGSESHGISEELIPFIQHLIKIPSYGKAESLNVAIATGILLNEFAK